MNRGGIDRFTEEELDHLMVQFWNAEAPDAIIEMVMESKNEGFKGNELTKELFARSFLMSRTNFSPLTAIAIANHLLKENPNNHEAKGLLATAHEIRNDCAAHMLQSLLKNEHNPEVLRVYDLAFPKVRGAPFKTSENLIESVTNNYAESLVLSTRYYKDAFASTYDTRYGARLMNRQLAQQNPEGAVLTANLIQEASLRDDVYHTKNLAIVKNHLEAACVLKQTPAEMEWLEAKMLSLIKSQKDNKNVLDVFDQIKVHLGKDENCNRIIAKLQKHSEDLKADKKSAIAERNAELKKLPLPTTDKNAFEWKEQTLTYRGNMSDTFAGNLKITGGQLTSHEVNRYTKDFLTQILDIPVGKLISKLPPEIDPKKRLEDFDMDTAPLLMDLFLREQFKTDHWNLEDINSPGHKEFERIQEASYVASGIPTQAAARKQLKHEETNLAEQLYVRLGDCRQHTQAKQMMCDILFERKYNAKVAELQIALDNKDTKAEAKIRKELEDMRDRDVRSWDTQVGYLDDDGNFVKIEEHTLNIMINTKEGELTEVVTSDAFYQDTYPLQSRPLGDLNQLPIGGNLFRAGTFHYKGKERPLVIGTVLWPTGQNRVDYNYKDHNNHYAGLRTQHKDPSNMLENNKQMNEMHQVMHDWHLNKSVAVSK